VKLTWDFVAQPLPVWVANFVACCHEIPGRKAVPPGGRFSDIGRKRPAAASFLAMTSRVVATAVFKSLP
jgi:hypothetical protein